jgi:hypothetical protein
MLITGIDVERYVHGEAEVVAEILIVRVRTDEGVEGPVLCPRAARLADSR